MYQDALWTLYTVRDDLEARANDYALEDRSTIDICMFSYFLRLYSLTASVYRDYSYKAAFSAVPC